MLLAGYGMARSPTRDAVVLWSYALVGAVGLGSTLFHGSLKFATQMSRLPRPLHPRCQLTAW